MCAHVAGDCVSCVLGTFLVTGSDALVSDLCRGRAALEVSMPAKPNNVK